MSMMDFDGAKDVSGDIDVMSDEEEQQYDPGDEEELEIDDEESGDEGEEADSDLEADEEGDEDAEGESDEDDPAPIDPPANWPQQEQQFFKALSPQLQHAYLDRARHMTADYTRKTQELSAVRQQYQEFDRVIGPRVQQWALNGMGPAQAVQQLIALSDFATNQPEQFINYFANLRGVDLQKLTQQHQDEYIDPQVAALRQHLAGVQAQLNQTTQLQQQQMQVAQQQQMEQAYSVTNAAIENFASQTDQNGKPLYPHFNELEEDMAALISSGRARTVHEAYESAKWANPYTRSKLLAKQRSAENANARQRAMQARLAASSLSGTASAYGSPATESMSIRDTLENVMNGAL